MVFNLKVQKNAIKIKLNNYNYIIINKIVREY